MDPELLAVLKPVKVVTYCNTVTATGQKQVKDITYDKVTLISLEQMYIEPQAAGEGEAHEYYKELNGTAKKFQWWLKMVEQAKERGKLTDKEYQELISLPEENK